MKKVLIFLRSQRLRTKIAAFASILTVFLGFYAIATNHPIVMIVAGAVAGFAAGFAIGALRQSMSRPPSDRRNTPDRRDHHSDHVHPQPV